MENRRFILIALLGVVLFFMYQAWQNDYGTAAQRQAQVPAAPAPSAAMTEDAPVAKAPEATERAEAPTSTVAAKVNTGARVHVRTDVLNVEIALAGGELRRAELIGYAEFKNKPGDLSLLDDRDPRWFVLQSGLAGTQTPLASTTTLYTAAQNEYVLGDGAETIEVALEAIDASGHAIRKIYRFKRGSYEIDLQQILKNGSAKEVVASPYVRFVRTAYEVGVPPKFTPTFQGVGLYEQKEAGGSSYRFKKAAFKKVAEEPIELQQTGGWIAMLQHYFTAAIIPPPEEKLSFNAKPARDRGYMAQYVGAAASIAPQQEHSFETRLYIGPQLQQAVDDVAPGFGLTLDYGILTPLAKPLFWVLEKFHKLTGNWGFAIILLTLSVKLLMFKLSEAQYRSMAKMKKFGPRIQDIKERYADDRERLQKAMMDLYKKEGFNPLAGCWPLLLQMPVFFALYWVLLQSVELRQVPFALWINDLSAPDPFYVLPVLYGISMWAQQKLSGQAAAMDPMQQKMMNVMPIALTAFFTFFPSGLVLYWLASNLIGITQQAYITRKLEKEGVSVRG